MVELSGLLRAKQTQVRLSWLPRLQNQEADDLTNENFDMSLRVEVEPSALTWIVLPQLMEASQELYNTIVAERSKREGPVKPFPWKKIKANARLRTSQPW